MSKNRNIQCHSCEHFFVTWETKHPYGCRAMNFKGKHLPSSIVLKTSGKKCMLFKAKNKNTSYES